MATKILVLALTLATVGLFATLAGASTTTCTTNGSVTLCTISDDPPPAQPPKRVDCVVYMGVVVCG